MSVEKILFDTTKNKEAVYALLLKNKNGTTVELLTYGATLRSIIVKGVDILLGRPKVSDYEEIDAYLGATVGRYCNRIKDGKFTLDGVEYNLAKNNGKNHLHGGNKGYNDMVWNIENISENSVTLSLFDEDMRENYPGNVNVEVTFSLSEEDALSINYKAKTDKRTFVSLTNHAYFNLDGGGDIKNQFIKIDADSYIPVDETSIPTGEIKEVSDSFDLREMKKFGTWEFDHNFVLNNPSLNKPQIKAYSENSKIAMEVYTDLPGVQLYTGNFLDGSFLGKDNKPVEKHTGFCLETQYFPDTPNNPHFPSCILNPEDTYNHTTIFKFSEE